MAAEHGKKGDVKLIATAADGIGACLRDLGGDLGATKVLEEGRGLAPVSLAAVKRLMEESGCGDRYREVLGLE